jgi:hypothetical protein
MRAAGREGLSAVTQTLRRYPGLGAPQKSGDPECSGRLPISRSNRSHFHHSVHPIKMWLQVPVEERDEDGKKRLTGGKGHDRGTPQGGVVSPLLAKLYFNRLLKGFRQTGREEQYRTRIVNYADDFVICRSSLETSPALPP